MEQLYRGNALDILASVVSSIQEQTPSKKTPPEHRVSCHRCGNIRKRKMLCPRSACPHIFCGRCADKMREEHGADVFIDGCPVCHELCCCHNKSIFCNRKNHCYRKCPATKGKGSGFKMKDDVDERFPTNREAPALDYLASVVSEPYGGDEYDESNRPPGLVAPARARKLLLTQADLTKNASGSLPGLLLPHHNFLSRTSTNDPQFDYKRNRLRTLTGIGSHSSSMNVTSADSQLLLSSFPSVGTSSQMSSMLSSAGSFQLSQSLPQTASSFVYQLPPTLGSFPRPSLSMGTYPMQTDLLPAPLLSNAMVEEPPLVWPHEFPSQASGIGSNGRSSSDMLGQVSHMSANVSEGIQLSMLTSTSEI